MTELKPLAWLDGLPIFEGAILYDLEFNAMRALRPWRTDYPLRMEHAGKKPPGSPDFWATDTHWKGQQVLFWNLEDIPSKQETNLYCRLLDQLDARKKRPIRRRPGRAMRT